MHMHVDDGLVAHNSSTRWQQTLDTMRQHFGVSIRLLAPPRVGPSGVLGGNPPLVPSGRDASRPVDSPSAAPPAAGTPPSPEASRPFDSTTYRSALGRLKYLANACRPDIAYAVNRLASHCSINSKCRPLERRQARPPLSSRHDVFSAAGDSLDLRGFSDSDWAGSREDQGPHWIPLVCSRRAHLLVLHAAQVRQPVDHGSRVHRDRRLCSGKADPPSPTPSNSPRPSPRRVDQTADPSLHRQVEFRHQREKIDMRLYYARDLATPQSCRPRALLLSPRLHRYPCPLNLFAIVPLLFLLSYVLFRCSVSGGWCKSIEKERENETQSLSSFSPTPVPLSRKSVADTIGWVSTVERLHFYSFL